MVAPLLEINTKSKITYFGDTIAQGTAPRNKYKIKDFIYYSDTQCNGDSLAQETNTRVNFILRNTV
jgi:hypothetical protein